jgi:hypothetical protein
MYEGQVMNPNVEVAAKKYPWYVVFAHWCFAALVMSILSYCMVVIWRAQ